MTAEMVIKNVNASPTKVAMVIKGSDDLAMLDVMKSICDVLGIIMEAFFNVTICKLPDLRLHQIFMTRLFFNVNIG